MIIPGVLAQQALLGGGGGLGPPAVGDYWDEQGGWYIGEYTLAGSVYYLVDGGAASEPAARLQAKTSNTATAAATSATDGVANTNAMMVSPSIHPAAAHCRSWAGGGFLDWYLPSRTELQLIRDVLWQTVPGVPENYSASGAQRYAIVGGTGGIGSYYWASDQTSAAGQAGIRMSDNFFLASYSKTNTCWVRPIRRVLKT